MSPHLQINAIKASRLETGITYVADVNGREVSLGHVATGGATGILAATPHFGDIMTASSEVEALKILLDALAAPVRALVETPHARRAQRILEGADPDQKNSYDRAVELAMEILAKGDGEVA